MKVMYLSHITNVWRLPCKAFMDVVYSIADMTEHGAMYVRVNREMLRKFVKRSKGISSDINDPYVNVVYTICSDSYNSYCNIGDESWNKISAFDGPKTHKELESRTLKLIKNSPHIVDIKK